jgi:hypothetical protein
MTHLICFHSSQQVPDLFLSHSSTEVPDLILSHSSQEMLDLYYAFMSAGLATILVQNLLPTDLQGENLFFYVSADCIQETCSREGERQLQQVSDILRQMQGETATSSSCLFMLSLLNLHMLAGLYLQSL